VHDVAILGAGAADEEVVGLDVAVDEVLFVDRLDSRELRGVSGAVGRRGGRSPAAAAAKAPCLRRTLTLRSPAAVAGCTHHLLRHHDDRLDGESPPAAVKEVLERGAQEVNHEYVVEALLAEVVDVGDAGCRR
jgi:hypothetical protein